MINKLTEQELNCNVFSVYDYDGLTMQELLSKFFTKINECINVSNNSLTFLEWLHEIGLKEEVAKKIQELITNGTLNQIINQEIFTDLSNKINTLSNQVSTINNEKYLFIGDSYAEGYTPDGVVTSWCKFTKQLMNIKDENYYSFYKGGVGFTNNGFQELLTTAINSIQDKQNVKHIIVGGGYNDANSYTTISVGMKMFVDTCKINFPNAKIYILPIGWCVEGLTTGLHINQKISNLVNVVLEYQRNSVICGVGYVDGIYSSLHSNNFFSSDFVHPNQNGQYNIALSLSNFLNNGTFNTVEYMKTEDIFANNVYENGISSSIKCVATVDGKNTNLNLTTGTITGNFANYVLNGTVIKLGKIRSAVINGCNLKTIFNTKVIVKTTDNKYYCVDGTIWIANNILNISLLMINEENTNFKTLSISEITIYQTPQPVTVNSLIN